ncbi:HD domain-containing phosphohydrolase [Maridesulfovibrio sp.]|uniref:HD-GYP domain-containing protein n=1 Tax=Maridesulfovibrio sp. TaxID=2795000 RepID=UPI002A1890D7|nr:HD domain-containing phosphohydrolase [Maridesulfovibrio sp.]
MADDSNLIEESYCAITVNIFKILPKTGLNFSLYKLNTSNGKFYPLTVPGKNLTHTERQSITNDCEDGLIYLKTEDLRHCHHPFAENLNLVLNTLGSSIPEPELALLILEGLKISAATIYVDSIKIHFESFHKTLCAAGEILHSNPKLLWLIIPLLDGNHSLVNKSVSTGIIGAAVILLGRELTPDVNVFLDAFCALFLCDIGLSSMPEFVLGKEFCLTRDEQKRIRQHPLSSIKVLSDTQLVSKPVMRAVLEHHERMDGSGYPRGVTNDQLSWLGKLCGAVDSFVAMTMERPGKKRMPIVDALKILYKESSQYDPNIIYALEKVTYRD